MTKTATETRHFEAETKQLLHLMIHSLYSNKEVFLRELISNAADACDKLRFEALADDSLYEGDSELKIKVDFDGDARTLSVSDNGIGMTRDEVIENIGTIARSGTRRFMEALSGDQAKDAHLIGQFGVGFYSAFIVADKVTLTTRRAGESGGTRWVSTGEGDYTLETVEPEHHGTTVTLHVREDEDEFLSYWRLREIIRKYSEHISLPVELPKQDDKGNKTDEWETVTSGQALWLRPRNELSDDDYQAFYKHVAHDADEPLAWTHNRVEGAQEYVSLLYIPARAPFDMWDNDTRRGVKLYVKRVFITDAAEAVMPRYLRFVRGVVDSSDLPLNVSRETLQNNRILDTIRGGSVKKVLGLLQDMADKEPEKYQGFWKQFGRVLKEGPAEDFGNREALAKLLRFASTHNDDDAETVSLDDYIERMKPDQKAIYYVTADSFAAAKNSPHLEIFRKQNIEVLLLHDRVDEWLVAHLNEYRDKPLKSVSRGELDAEAFGDAPADDDKALPGVCNRLATSLDGKVKEVRVSRRLTDSPACLVASDEGLSLNLERLLKEAGQDVPKMQPILEINATHPIVKRLENENSARFDDWANLLYEQALLAEGGQLDDPAVFVKRLNDLLLSQTLSGG
ncbi:MAG TPA: molecular chaperone HtpG [Gammaproteobacteria bacterium]|jgi:molecular chaperone HtpG|nr:molecular chaperone HtpG [Gammaproteobacteria bacterium]